MSGQAGRAPAVALSLAIAAGAVACGMDAPSDSVEEAPVGGGTAIVAFNSEMGSFNPLTNTDQNTNEVNYYMLFTPLISYDAQFEPQPRLASGWELDSLGVTFELQRDVYWHDGRRLTAHDVKFTFDRAKQPETASPLSSAYLQWVASAEIIDSFTIRFDFERPHARQLDGFWWAPVPKHALEGIEPAALVRAEFNRRPVGSGPFRFVRWDAGEQIVLERNPDFAESLGGPPPLERVIFRFVPESATLLSETLTGGIDVNGSIFPHQAQQVAATPRARLISFPSREYYYIGWNIRKPILRDRRVRRALALAIDRQQLIDVLLYGHGAPAAGTIAPWHPMHSGIEPLPYDPTTAREGLRDLGWVDRDGDGTLEDSQGRQFSFTLMTNQENPVRVDIAQMVQARLAEVGIVAEVRTLEWQTLLTRHRSRDFEAVVQSWVLDNFRVDPAALFHSSQADRPGSYNRSGLKDAGIDSLIEAAVGASDQERARALWAEFSLALQEAQPFTFLMWLNELAAVSDRVRGVEMDARGMLVSIQNWWIPTQLQN